MTGHNFAFIRWAADPHDWRELLNVLQRVVEQDFVNLHPTEWRPLAVFDDGHQVFIEMPPIISKIEAPPLFVSGPEGAEMVNYRVRGNFYIVDRLFQRAELKLGTGWGAKTVKIERTAPLGGNNG